MKPEYGLVLDERTGLLKPEYRLVLDENGTAIATFKYGYDSVDIHEVLRSRKEIEEIAGDYGFLVADLPTILEACNSSLLFYPDTPEESAMIQNSSNGGLTARAFVEDTSFDSMSFEYHGLRDGKPVYEIWHGFGSLSTPEGLERAINNSMLGRGFMAIDINEWEEVGLGKFRGEDIIRVHLEDVKKGYLPSPGTPYVIYVGMEEPHNISGETRQIPNRFAFDDRVLMASGSLKNREMLTKIIDKHFPKFLNPKDKRFYNCHDICEKTIGFDETPKGRWILMDSMYGLLDTADFRGANSSSKHSQRYQGRFFAISEKILSEENRLSPRCIVPEPIFKPSLEETLAITNNPDLNRSVALRNLTDINRIYTGIDFIFFLRIRKKSLNQSVHYLNLPHQGSVSDCAGFLLEVIVEFRDEQLVFRRHLQGY